jgi:hypothetical protein
MRHSIRGSVLCVISVLLVGAAPQNASAQSLWKKLKIAALQQACRGGDQKACQDLAKMGQPQPQPGRQPQISTQPRTAQSRQSQPQPSRAQNESEQARGESGQVAPPAGTKVDVKMMAPVEQGAKFSISPHGVHVATIEDSGSRVVVYYDGVAGPKFDEIFTINSGQTEGMQIAFSPDGKRYAYCARSGGDLVVMVDGKELTRSSDSHIDQATSNPCALLGFTSNSQHVFYTSYVFESTSAGGSFTRFYFDGKLNPIGASPNYGGLQPVFSPDGNHYAYVDIDPVDRNRWSLVIDGKVAPYQGGDPQWSGDSQHLYTTIEHSGPHAYMEAMLDGKPFLRANNINLHVPAKGNMVVAEVSTANGNQPEQYLVIDGSKVPGSDMVGFGSRVDMVTLSPDGKHYAARITISEGRQLVLWDGKRQQEYQTVDNIGFTADSSKVVYTAFANGKPFVIYGDQESDTCAPELSRISYAPVGNGAGTVCQGNAGPNVFVNGKMIPIVGIGGSHFKFTPDGKHFAYVAFLQGQVLQLVLDGVAEKDSRLSASTAQGNQYIFSPDGEHIAHFANSPDPSRPGSGVFLDGKFIPIGDVSMFDRIAFTPDSKHLMWAEPMRTTSGTVVAGIFVDGKLIVQKSTPYGGLDTPAPWWDVSPDGILSFLAQENNSLERITIAPSPNTSIQTLLSGAR